MITSFSTDQIGADASIYCGGQSSDGILYFGGSGLLSYDGERWTMINVPGVRSITHLDIGANGRVWVAAHGDVGWFEKQPDEKWRFHSLRPFTGPAAAVRGQVEAVLADGQGVVFATPGRIYRWDGGAMRSWSIPELKGPRCFRVNGEIWIQGYGSSVYRLGPDGPERLRHFSLGTPEPAMLLWVRRDGKRWLYGTKTELVIVEDGVRHGLKPAATHFLRTGQLTFATEVPDGRLVCCTSTQGIVFINPDGTLDQVLGQEEGVPSFVRSVFIDREGYLWTTSSNGVQRIDLNPDTRIYDDRAGVPARPFTSISMWDGRVAAADVQGVITLSADHRKFLPLPEAVPVVEHLARAPAGLLIPARHGLWEWNGTRTRQLSEFGGDLRFALPSRLHPGEVLVSNWSPPMIFSVQSGREPRKVVDGLEVVASSLAEDNDGLLWFGTDTRGAYVARVNPTAPALPERPNSRYGLPEIVGMARVQSTPQGDLFVIGQGRAWVKRRGDPAFASIRNFPDRPVAALSPCLPDGSFWIAHSASNSLAPCIALVSYDGGWRWAPHSVPHLDAIGSPTSLFGQKDAAGHTVLWIGGTKAILRHVVPETLSVPSPAAPLLHAFTRNLRNERQPITGTLPYSTGVIEFEFAEPLARRALLHLQTRIRGIDSDWMPANRDSRRELTAVRDGNYSFEVRAVAETGAVSAPTRFSFTVAPPWWRTPAAIGGYLLAAISLIYGVHRLRIRSLRQRNAALEQRVRERTEELAEASAAKTLFVANMSHDIRNPLNGIVGLALALEDSRLDHQQREIVATLRECTTYLSSLVDDVLDFATIEAGRVELRPGPFAPSELLNSVVTTLKAQAGATGTFITIEADPELPGLVQGDAGRIQQILVNFVSNALKYAGGHIRLSASVPPGSPGEVEFAVADEGPGISETDQAGLFTKFSRLDGARRSHIPGTGLGLASCRLLADIMGGAVGVESQLGHGARFYLRLPLTIATEPMPASVALTLRATVLLVEDTDYNAMAAAAVLRKLGLGCERARNGEEAIRMFTATRHNIVLLDRNLPDIDGTEVARRIREVETDGMRSVLLAVTAYCSAEDRARCLQAGMDAFVGKPLTPEKLRRVFIAAGRRLLATATADATPEAKTVGAPAAIDISLLEYLAAGTTGGIAAQAERYIAALQEAHANLMSASAKAGGTELADAAHRLLGHARLIGASALADAAREMEAAAQTDNARAIAAGLPIVTAEVANLTAALRRACTVETT